MGYIVRGPRGGGGGAGAEHGQEEEVFFGRWATAATAPGFPKRGCNPNSGEGEVGKAVGPAACPVWILLFSMEQSGQDRMGNSGLQVEKGGEGQCQQFCMKCRGKVLGLRNAEGMSGELAGIQSDLGAGFGPILQPHHWEALCSTVSTRPRPGGRLCVSARASWGGEAAGTSLVQTIQLRR